MSEPGEEIAMPTRVLVPYDRSEQAEYALQHALSEFESGEILLEHVIKPSASYTGEGGYDTTLYKQQLENAEEMLENVRQRCDEPERIEPVVHFGRPVHRILETVEDREIDHVVMGSHGRDGASRLLLGSVAETVSRRSPVPVTVVREPTEHYEKPDHVLVPFEGSETSKTALGYALEQFEGATVTALYVAYPADQQASDTEAVFEMLDSWDQERADHINSILSAAEAVAAEHDQPVETKNVNGSPTEAIVEFVEEADVDHVVVGSTGRDGFTRLLLGSVAETVIRRSPTSVTVVKQSTDS